MPRPPDSARLDRAVERVLRGFARVGLAAVGVLILAGRTRRGRQAAQALDARLTAADRLVTRHSATLDPLAERTAAALDRLLGRWLS